MMNDTDRPATQGEAYNEMVCNLGAANADHCWILTPFDTWEKNPAYTGPMQPHPDDDEYSKEDYQSDVKAAQGDEPEFVDHTPDPYHDAEAYDAEQQPEHGWPGDGSGEDDLADYNSNEADDYRDE